MNERACVRWDWLTYSPFMLWAAGTACLFSNSSGSIRIREQSWSMFVRAPAALLEDMYLAQGEYSVIIGGGKVPLYAGQEYFIPKGLAHAGEYSAGTRTIHAFGGKRAEVDAEM